MEWQPPAWCPFDGKGCQYPDCMYDTPECELASDQAGLEAPQLPTSTAPLTIEPKTPAAPHVWHPITSEDIFKK